MDAAKLVERAHEDGRGGTHRAEKNEEITASRPGEGIEMQQIMPRSLGQTSKISVLDLPLIVKMQSK